jgi:2-methylisocitrate lyase-like PEP mutase family enzyme
VSFRDLHDGDLPFLLPNAWDVASALAFAAAGLPADGYDEALVAPRAHAGKVAAITRAEAVRDGAAVPSATPYPEMQARLVDYSGT